MINSLFSLSCKYVKIDPDLNAFELTNMKAVQVNLCQKLLFLHQLTHNLTDCSWMKTTSAEHGQTCSAVVVFMVMP